MKQINNTLRCLFSVGALTTAFVANGQKINTVEFSKVDIDEFEKTYALSAEELIQHQAGVTITSTDGAPFSRITTLIRGINSFRGDSDPLWVVDGVILNPTSAEVEDLLWTTDDVYMSIENRLSGISPTDIESIEVLKDLQATAIYGAQGANGVIVIKTRAGRGTRGNGYDLEFRSNISLSLANTGNATEMLSLDQFKTYQNALGNSSYDSLKEDYSVVDNSFSPAVSSNTSFTIAGSEQGQRYLMSFNFKSIDGIIDDSEGIVANLRINYSNKVGTYMDYGTTTSLSYTSYNAPASTTSFGDASTGTLLANGIPASDYDGESVSGWLSDYDDINTEYRAIQGLHLNFTILKGFTFENRVGLDYRKESRFLWMGNGTAYGLANGGVVSQSYLEDSQVTVESALVLQNYVGDHFYKVSGRAGLLVGEEMRSTSVGTSFFNHDLRATGLRWADNQENIHLYFQDDFTHHYTVTGEYAYKGVVGVNGTMRADNNIRFDQGNFIYYPSLGAFVDLKKAIAPNSTTLSALRISGGFGQAGTEESFHYDMFSDYISSTGYYPSIDESLAIYYPGLTRTHSTEYNVGLDFALLANRIQGRIAAYQKETVDGLYLYREGYSKTVDDFGTYTGVWTPCDAVLEFANESKVGNKGVELSLAGVLINEKDMRWDVSFVGAWNTNEVLDVTYNDKYGMDLGDGVSATTNVVGAPVGSFYGLETVGIVTANNIASAPTYNGNPAQIGDVLYYDASGDGNINASDNILLGNPNPSFSGSISTSFRYKKFSASLLFDGVYGNDILNLNRLIQEDVSSSMNISKEAYENAGTGDYPAIGAQGTGVVSSKYVEDGSYLRLSSLTLGYDFAMKSSSLVKGVTVNLSATNLFTLTNYSGWSPDVNSYSRSISTYGIDYGSYPSSTSIILGVKLTF